MRARRPAPTSPGKPVRERPVILPAVERGPSRGPVADAAPPAGTAPRPARPLPRRIERVLFVTATRIGDAVLSTGLLDHLLRTCPEARFTIACGPATAELFLRMPRRVRTIVVDKRRYDRHWIDLWRQTVGTRWDLVIDLRGSALSLLLPARARRIMRGGRRPGHRLVHLAGVLGLDPPPLPVVWTDAADAARAASLLPAGRTLIGLGPTANWAGKVWPAEKFVALFRAVSSEGARLEGAVPAVFAGPGEAERALAAPVLDALPGAVDLAGRLSLPEAAAALRRMALFVGNDSGLMHLAAAAGTPTVGLFGPSAVAEYAPSGPWAVPVVADGPAGRAPIADLPVARVAEAVAALLARAAGD